MVAPSRAPPGSSSVRRNLFNSTHSRRATSQSSADTVQLAISEDQPETQPWDNGILVRDAEGNIVYDDPIPEPDRDEQPDSRDPFSEEEKEKNDAIREAAGILELYRSQTRKSVGENQKEKKALILASLNKISATLEEDKWMYETEESTEPNEAG